MMFFYTMDQMIERLREACSALDGVSAVKSCYLSEPRVITLTYVGTADPDVVFSSLNGFPPNGSPRPSLRPQGVDLRVSREVVP